MSESKWTHLKHPVGSEFEVYLLKSVFLYFVSAFGVAQSEECRSMDALHPNVQGQTLQMGPTRGPLGQLQDRPQRGHHPQEALRAGGGVLQTPPGRSPHRLCAEVSRHVDDDLNDVNVNDERRQQRAATGQVHPIAGLFKLF